MEAATVPARRPAAPARRAAPPVRLPTRKAPARKASTRAPARKAPARRVAPSRRPGGQLIPLAVGTAGAVRRLPDSSLMVRLARGRAWIAVLGVLLTGIVAVNVVTLSLAASLGHIDGNMAALEQENSLLRSRDAERSGAARVRHEAAGLGLIMPTSDRIEPVRASPRAVAVAARRLAAAAGG